MLKWTRGLLAWSAPAQTNRTTQMCTGVHLKIYRPNGSDVNAETCKENKCQITSHLYCYCFLYEMTKMRKILCKMILQFWQNYLCVLIVWVTMRKRLLPVSSVRSQLALDVYICEFELWVMQYEHLRNWCFRCFPALTQLHFSQFFWGGGGGGGNVTWTQRPTCCFTDYLTVDELCSLSVICCGTSIPKHETHHSVGVFIPLSVVNDVSQVKNSYYITYCCSWI